MKRSINEKVKLDTSEKLKKTPRKDRNKIVYRFYNEKGTEIIEIRPGEDGVTEIDLQNFYSAEGRSSLKRKDWRSKNSGSSSFRSTRRSIAVLLGAGRYLGSSCPARSRTVRHLEKARGSRDNGRTTFASPSEMGKKSKLRNSLTSDKSMPAAWLSIIYCLIPFLERARINYSERPNQCKSFLTAWVSALGRIS